MLLNKQLGLSNNILKSVIKNYLDWASPIPNDATDLINIYNPSNSLGAFVLPLKILSWNESAIEDASILKDQAKGIQILTDLREFYLDRTKNAVQERKTIVETQTMLQPVKALDSQMKGYLSGLSWLKWVPKK